MPDGREPIVLKVLSSLGEVSAAAWDACAGSANPFVGHAFLSALEDSGCATAETGWQAQHLLLEDGSGSALGAVPLYLKTHSYGEYVFDWGWAEAYERAGGRYYPKLQSCVPFTPVTGPRLLIRPDADAPQVAATLIAGLRELTRRHGVSSLHVSFPLEADWAQLGEAGFLKRVGLQYHWENRGYADFDGFLAALSSRKRKQIRKERRTVAESGVRLRALAGGEIEERHWDAFHRFYLDTSDRKWGQPYLNRDFFLRLGETLAERIVLVVAELDGRMVAAALNLLGDGVLYGRNWGCASAVKYLHFEACYYQAIAYAIAHGLERVEAGAQGEHKVQRGYLPVETYSAHLLGDSGFSRAVADFLERERQALRAERAAIESYSPYRQAP
jgi:predicted N-acyltransferase